MSSKARSNTIPRRRVNSAPTSWSSDGRRAPSNAISIADLPLTLNVDVDFGHNLTFEGSGLDDVARRKRPRHHGARRHLNGRGIDHRGATAPISRSGKSSRSTAAGSSSMEPLDNPALDVVALRKNLAVEAGVELTGTVKVPRVRITSKSAGARKRSAGVAHHRRRPRRGSRTD